MIAAIRKRRSVREFLKREVEERKLRAVLKAAHFAPTSWGTRAWEFIVVRDREKKKALSGATEHAYFVKDAPLVIVVCYNQDAGRRFREDSSIAAAYMLLEAVNQGLGSCFVQVNNAGTPPGSAEPYVKKLLGIPQNHRVQCMLPVGYPKRKTREHTEREFKRPKVRYEHF